MTQITEDYISFETAKLLKEKGFDELTYACFSSDGKETYYGYRAAGDDISRPTLAMVMKWLREVHYIHISPFVKSITRWGVQIFNSRKARTLGCKPLEIPSLMRLWANSYEEACEAGIRYCLENLI